MTLEFIRFHAHRKSASIALGNNGVPVSYGELYRSVSDVMAGLRAFEIAEGSVVAIGCKDPYLELVLLLACEGLSVVRAPFAGPEDPAGAHWIAAADVVVTDAPIKGPKPQRHLQVSGDWIRAQQALARGGSNEVLLAAPLAPPAPDTPALILSTSGTTGAAKRILLSARVLDGRIRERVWQYGLSRHARFLVATPLSVGVVLTTVFSCLELGATVVFDSNALLESRLEHLTHVVLLPVHLRRLLDALPAGQPKPQNLTVVSIGALLGGRLRERVLERLASELFDSYGSNEAGPICSIESDGFGQILPGVEVRIEDERGSILAEGQAGLLAVRGPWMCQGYLADPMESARKFRSGWFYPGDIGVKEHGRIRIIGRADELLNIGGIKVAPWILEEALGKHMPQREVAICAIAGGAGIEEVCVAVTGSTPGASELVAIVKTVLGPEFGEIHIVQLDGLPLGPHGKLQREQLKALLTQSVAAAKARRA
ncbi:MAG: class I adenylate-forming enzyme family protein [Burkholderiaceae bacterium]|jgi:acyl-CoA synthetase (AMP-forming)/AMP-acid ligase II